MTIRPARALVVGAVSLAGCGEVFGLTEVPLPEPYGVSGSITSNVIDLTNLSHVTEVVHPAFALGEVKLSVSYAQTLDEPVDFTGNNTFAFEPIGPYALAIQRGDTPIIQLDGDAAAATIAFDLTDVGRLDAQPLPVPSPTLSFAALTGFVDQDVPVIETEGLYTETVLPPIADGVLTLPTVPWSDAGRIGTTFGMLEIARDQVYIAAHVVDPVNFVNTIRAYFPTYLTLTASDTPVVGALGPNNAPLRCLHILAHRGDELDHVRNSLEVAPFSTRVRWSILGVPAPAITPVGGALVAYENDLLPELAPIHEVPVLAFGNPYSETKLIASFGAHTTYRFTAPGATATSMQAGTTVFYSPIQPNDCATSPPLVELGVAVAIPGVPTLAQTRLTSAHTLTLSGDFVEMTWNEVASGGSPTDAFHLVIYEVVNVGGATQLVTTRRVFTTVPTTRLPTAMFVPGHTYVVRVESRIGYPGAAHGDYETIAYPFGFGAVFSAPFTIAQP